MFVIINDHISQLKNPSVIQTNTAALSKGKFSLSELIGNDIKGVQRNTGRCTNINLAIFFPRLLCSYVFFFS